MQGKQFDVLTRTLSSRRAALGGLLGGGIVTLLGLAPEESAAHNPVARCRKLSDPTKRRTCLRRARTHNQQHRCKPLPSVVVCAGLGRCSGTAVNTCGRLINCTCPAGKICLGNGSCDRTCGPNLPCPRDCICGPPSTEGPSVSHCVPDTVSCFFNVIQPCASTVNCPVGQYCSPNVCGPGQDRCVPVCPT
jgi:hypothetical protein